MSITSGLYSGLRSGLQSGLNPGGGAVDPFAGVTKDATSNKYVPANSSEWTTFRTAGSLSTANPNSLWLCQETSGNLSDSIGSLTLTANATPTYDNAVTGWTRKGLGFTQVANQRFGAAAGVGPSPATTSQMWLWIVTVTATPAATRGICQVSNGATVLQGLLTSTPRARINVGGTTTDGTNSPATETNGMPVVLLYDRSGSRAMLYTSQEKITGTYSAGVVDGVKGIGAGTSFPGFCVYGAMWSGAAAEAFTDANVKSLLQTMGFTIPWS